jgi:membrane-associated phospholipid phosphatase
MVSRLTSVTAAVIFLGATLFHLPVYAESPAPAPPQAAAETSGGPAKHDIKLSDVESSDVDKIDLKYLKGYVVDTGKILASPLHWDKKDWLKLGVVLGVTGSLFLVDDKVKEFAQSNRSPVASKFASVGNALGDPLVIAPSLGAMYLYGYVADDSKARRASLLALEGFAISGIFTSGLKSLIQRHRPNTGDAPGTFDGPRFSAKNVSFCSGHTSSAFAIATVFADVYKDNDFVPPIAYGLATLTGLSRIYSNQHWASDAFFGAALGYFTSKALLSFHKEDKNKLGNRLSILPEVGKQMTGLSVRYVF